MVGDGINDAPALMQGSISSRASAFPALPVKAVI